MIQEEQRKSKKMIKEAENKRVEAENKRIEAEQDAKNSKIKLAQKMLKYGDPIKEVISETGLSESEILILQS